MPLPHGPKHVCQDTADHRVDAADLRTTGGIAQQVVRVNDSGVGAAICPPLPQVQML